jgi:hypothetical protein
MVTRVKELELQDTESNVQGRIYRQITLYAIKGFPTCTTILIQ